MNYFVNEDASRKLEQRQTLTILGAGAIAGGFFFRKPLLMAAETLLKDLSKSPKIQRAAQAMATKTFDALDHVTAALAENPFTKNYFKASASPILRRDLSAVSTFLSDDLSRSIQQSEAAKFLRVKMEGPVQWSSEKTDALLQDKSLFQALLHAQGTTAQKQAEIRSLLNTEQGTFYEFLGGSKASEELLNKTSAELNEVIHGNTNRSIGLSRIRENAGARNNVVRATAGRYYAQSLTKELTESPLEAMFGIRQALASDAEKNQYAQDLRVSKKSLVGLRQDWLNGQFSVGDKSYDVSGYIRVGQDVSRFVNERINIPFAPLQTAMAPGQAFPFLKRAADGPKIALLDTDYVTGKFSLFVHDRTLTSDAALSTGRYEAIKANKRHLKELLEARHGGNPDFSLKSFLSPHVAPGTVPYWDAPAAFLRKFSDDGKHYLPRVLRSAADGNVLSSRDALDVVNTLRHTPKFIDDAFMMKALKGLQSLQLGKDVDHMIMTPEGVKVQHLDSDIDKIVATLEEKGDSLEKWAKSHNELHNISIAQVKSAPRMRKFLQELSPFAGDIRSIKSHLGQTASFSAGRGPERLLGLKLDGGASRLTKLDVLKQDMLNGLITEAKKAGKSTDQIAEALKDAGPDVLSLVYAHGLEDSAATGTLPKFIKERPHVQELLRDIARRTHNVLDLLPKQRAPWEDFTDRKRLILLEKDNSFENAYHKSRAEGKHWLRSLFDSTSLGTSYNRARKSGLDEVESVFNSFKSQYKATKEVYFDGTKDTKGSMYAYWMSSRLHEFAENLGWGLPGDWRRSPGKLMAGLLVGRLLPLIMLPEANKLFNRVTRDTPGLQFLNPDMHRAHFLKMTGHLSHKLVDHRHLVGLLPGLDFYTDSRTSKEQDIHAKYADYTPVRKGRFWLFGSREAVFGSKVSYYLPSAGRLAQSDWQAAGNVDRNSNAYWLHAGGYLNPVNIIDPYWRERKHEKDWGLSSSGPAFDPGYVWNTPLNIAFSWLKPRHQYNKDYVPVHLGGNMRSLPTENSPGTTDPDNLARTTQIPLHFKLTDPSRLGLGARRRGAQAVAELQGQNPRSISQRDYRLLSRVGNDSQMERMAHNYQELSGLYGWMAGTIFPDIARPQGRFQLVDASRGYGVENKFWSQELGGIGGTTSDILRRFFPHRRRSIHDFDEAPNNLPDYLPENLRKGNAYARLDMGFLRLPGGAYTRSHPGAEQGMLGMRASSLGKSPEEIREHFLHPEGDGRTSHAAEEGTKMHRVLQARWKALGILEADEIAVYDKEHRVSGHIDGILRLRTANGDLQRTIVDIKTKTTERFEAVKKSGIPEQENLEQIQFYMHTTGIHHALLTYVNRDKPDQIYEVPVEYDPELMKHIFEKLEGVRKELRSEVKKGTLNEGSLYSAIDRYEILSDVAPNSQEFQKMAHWASTSYEGMDEEDKYRVDSAKQRMARKQKGFELHDYRFRNLNLKAQTITVAKVISATAVQDASGRTFNIAGVKMHTETPYEDASELLEKEMGISVGSKVKVLTAPNDTSMNSKAVVLKGGMNVAKRLMRLGLADEDIDDNSAPAIRNRTNNAERTIGRMAETIGHLNNPINTKIMPLRSGLEQYERTDVYGKSHGSWDSPVRSYITPTIESFLNKDPLSAAVMGGFVGSLFGQWGKEKLIIASTGALTGAVVAIVGGIGRSVHGPVIPGRVKKRREIEEYYDNLTYMKYRALAAQEASLAYKYEKINIDDLKEGRGITSVANRAKLEKIAQQKQVLRDDIIEAGARHNTGQAKAAQEAMKNLRLEEQALNKVSMPLGNHALRAILFRDRSLSTLRGTLETGDTNAAIRALPQESRAAIEDVIRNGTQAEKNHLYALLPNNQKTALGAALGKNPNSVPRAQGLAQYFEKHHLPSVHWAGWSADTSLELIEVKDIVDNHKDLDPMDFGIYPGRIEEATLMSPEASIQSPQKSSGHGHLQERIEALLAGHGLPHAKVEVRSHPPSFDQSSHQAQVTMKVKHRRENAALSY